MKRILRALLISAVWASGGHPAAADRLAPAVFAPTMTRGLTRVRGTIRPFLSVLGQGVGTIADLSVDHYFARLPARVSL
jgi:hypothetical protein